MESREEIKQYSLEWYREIRKLNKDTIISLVESNGKQRDALKEQNKSLLQEVERLKGELKATEWISIDEQKPKINENVICCNINDDWVVSGYINIKKQWYNQFKDDNDDCEIYPTHWMPLPNKPKTN